MLSFIFIIGIVCALSILLWKKVRAANAPTGSKILRIIIGTLVMLVGGLLIAGPGILVILMYSIMCTAGAGIFLWLALAYGIGTVVLGAVSVKTVPASGPTPTTQILSTKDQVAISNYVRDAFGAGMSDGDIRSKLSEAGWVSTDIEAGFLLAAK